MKKTLLALAVLGAFAGAASAQSSVTVYGLVDAGISSFDQGGDKGSGFGTVNGVTSGNDGASKIGFKGVEDLGNGLKAEFTLENGFDTNTGEESKAGLAFGRLAFVGLDGGFGKVRLGRQNTQVKDLLGMIDPFGAAGMVNSVDFFNGGGLDQRNPNQIVWMSNNYGGFSGGLAYQFGETDEGTGVNSGYSARFGYKNGPLNVQAAYQKAKEDDAAIAPVTAYDKNAMIGATYDFGGFKLHGLFGERKIGGSDGVVSVQDKIHSGLIGVTVPFGASEIRAEYIRNQNKDVDDADSNVFAVSYTYAMSKRTHLYATYVGTQNDDNSALGIGTDSVPGENARGIAIGVAHAF